MASDSLSNEHRLSIGLPVYNGEKFLQNRLDGILSIQLQIFVRNTH